MVEEPAYLWWYEPTSAGAALSERDGRLFLEVWDQGEGAEIELPRDEAERLAALIVDRTGQPTL